MVITEFVFQYVKSRGAKFEYLYALLAAQLRTLQDEFEWDDTARNEMLYDIDLK